MKPKSGQSDEVAVSRILAPKRAAALRDSAVALDAAGLTDTANELREKANELDAQPSSLERVAPGYIRQR